MGLLSYLFGVDSANAAAADAATSKLMDMNLLEYNQGKIDLAEYQRRQGILASNLQDNAGNDAAIGGAFVDGAVQGFNDIGKNIQLGTNWTFSRLWSWIPWQVKVIGGIILALWLFSFISPVAKRITKL